MTMYKQNMNDGRKYGLASSCVSNFMHINPKAEEVETYDDKYINKEEQGARDAKDLAADEATKSKEVTDAARSAIYESKGQRTNLSDEAAALLIQSAYRGFEVRRWEPLKKLKQIAMVQEQVVAVKDKIHALESSSDLQNDDRQRLVIEEMIMSLLLKLDAIQVRMHVATNNDTLFFLLNRLHKKRKK